MAKGYEVLRASVLATDFFNATRCGLSVFLSQGMAAWMQVYRLLPARRPPESESALCKAPSGMVDEVAGLIADIFLNHQEASRC